MPRCLPSRAPALVNAFAMSVCQNGHRHMCGQSKQMLARLAGSMSSMCVPRPIQTIEWAQFGSVPRG